MGRAVGPREPVRVAAQLHRACLIQREKSPSIAGRPRIEAFPGLCRIERPDRADEEDRCWELSHVDRFLGEVVLYRRAHAGSDRAVWLGPRPGADPSWQGDLYEI